MAEFQQTTPEKLAALKRRKSWRELESVPKKFKREFLAHIPATSLKNFVSFQKWAESSIFRIGDYCIDVEIIIDDNIEKQWPLNYNFCQRCETMKNSNKLDELFNSINWKDLMIADVPSDVPLPIKTLATTAKAAIKNRSDNTSMKSYIHALLDVFKTHWFCIPHSQDCEIVRPKSTHDVGGFEVPVVVEELVSDLETEAEGEAGGEESLGRVYDLRPSSQSHNSPTSTETETSSSSISPELRTKMLSPKTNDVVYLTGIPDVLMLSKRTMTVVSAEEKIEKETPSSDVTSSDAGQLLFYILAHALQSIKRGDTVCEVGLFTEGFQALLCHSSTRKKSSLSKNVKVVLKVSPFYNLLSAVGMLLTCKALFAFAQLSFETY